MDDVDIRHIRLGDEAENILADVGLALVDPGQGEVDQLLNELVDELKTEEPVRVYLESLI